MKEKKWQDTIFINDNDINIVAINEMSFRVNREKNGIFRRVWEILRFIFVGEATFKI